MEKIRNFGWVIGGFFIFSVLIVISALIFFGMAKASSILYPSVSVLASASITAFLLIILPLSVFQRCRPVLLKASFILSYVCGASVWMFAVLLTLA
jgi:hypothetical protein